MTSRIAPQANHITRPALLETFDRLSGHIRYLTDTAVEEVVADGVLVRKDGEVTLLPADTVIYSVGLRPKRELAEAFERECTAPFFRMIGDCASVGAVRQAIYSGYHAAMDIL